MAEGLIGLVAMKEAVDVDEDLLRHIFGVALIAEDSRGASLDPKGMSVHQFCEILIRVSSALLA